MINLTSAEQQIVKSDSTRKNFRVHFPNGERSDITNDEIVFESVQFTESVCKEQSFRFGCAESSVIEFEAVGVENIAGMTIECSMEFDGGVVIPYGKVEVDTSPRDHNAIPHRKVTAYSKPINNSALPPYEVAKLSGFYDTNTPYQPNIGYLLDSVLGESGTYTETAFCSLTSYRATSTNTNDYLISDDGVYRYYISMKRVSASSWVLPEALYRIVPTYDSTLEDIIKQAFEDYPSINWNQRASIWAATHCHIQYDSPANWGTVVSTEDGTIYPYINSDMEAHFSYPLSITNVRIYKKRISNSEETEIANYGSTVFTPYTALDIYKRVADNYTPIRLSFNSTLQQRNYLSKTLYGFYNSYSLADIVQGWAELNAGFIRANRDGTYSMIRLDNSNPYPLTPADVAGSAWWDEYDIHPIGTVRYKYTDKNNNEQQVEYQFSDDPSIYDMSENQLLSNLYAPVKSAKTASVMTDTSIYYRYTGSESGYTKGDLYYYDGTSWVSMGAYGGLYTIINFLLDTLFIPHCDVQFTPVDMSLRGMPFLQAGDAFTFTAEDGTVIHSYILSQTFDGIQYIEQDLDTVQGEVIKLE